MKNSLITICTLVLLSIVAESKPSPPTITNNQKITISPAIITYVNCFVSSTKVLMANDPDKNIEDIKIGDIVLAYDLKKKRHVLAQVEGVTKEEQTELVRYVFSNNTSLVASKDHPLLLKSLEWASSSPEKTERYASYDNVLKIKPGDQVRQLATTVSIEKIEPLNEKRTSYTISKLSQGDAFFANGCSVGVEGLRDELLVKKSF